jgi:predicted nucleotidyltransferase
MSEKLIMQTIFGSRLYGTNDEDSDTDYKRIVIPEKREILLGRIFKSRHQNTKSGEGKNTKNDTDIETLSIHYFFKLLCEGQTMALDILHAKPYRPSLYWKIIQESREMFYTSEMSAFMGYCLHQAAKYSIKGSRLHSAKMFRDCLTKEILGDCKIPYNDHIKQVSMLSYPEQQAVEVIGKMFSLKTKTEYVKPIIEKFINEYGKRSQLAEQNQGIDYKAISHAFRACFEVREICETRNLEFPLRDRKFLLEVKHGNIKNWQQKLEEEIEITKEALRHSNFPQKVDQQKADNLLVGIVLAA